MGRATAMAVLLFLVIFAMTLVQLRLLREKE
jgi:ABC-type sugar transport system permease subunit